MTENEQTPPEYQKGFNDGYFLAKHMPDLADKLIDMSGNSLQINALKKGIEEYQLEKNRDFQPKWLKADRLTNFKDNFEKDKSKDDLEKE